MERPDIRNIRDLMRRMNGAWLRKTLMQMIEYIEYLESKEKKND